MTKLWKQGSERRDPRGLNPAQIERCLYCGQPAEIVWVHGHGQCAHCGINTDECCRGETCEND